MDCSLTSFRDAPPAERSWEPVVVSDCVFRVEACVDRHDASRASLAQRHFEPGSTIRTGMQPVSVKRARRSIDPPESRRKATAFFGTRTAAFAPLRAWRHQVAGCLMNAFFWWGECNGRSCVSKWCYLCCRARMKVITLEAPSPPPNQP